MKVSELSGIALDWAVAKAGGTTNIDFVWELTKGKFNPSTDWARGGVIIEREGISVSREFSSGRIEWAAWTFAHFRDDAEAFGYGETPLIAAMRCYVASKLGDEVQLPEGLK